MTTHDNNPKAEKDQKADVEIVRQIAHLNHTLSITLKANFIPYFDRLFPYFRRFLVADRPAADRQWAICIFDDILENCSPQSIKYSEHFIPAILAGLTDESQNVRQASFYGIGVMALVAGDAYIAHCLKALPTIQAVVTSKDARADTRNAESIENGISAMVKIVRHPKSGVPLSTFLPELLKLLPFKEDREESEYVYSYLCDLIVAKNPAFTPPCLVRFLFVISEAVNTVLVPVDSQTGLKCRQTIQFMQQAHGAAAMAHMFAQLPAVQQAKLRILLK